MRVARSETHIKNQAVKTAHVDYKSMYPSVYVLQYLWDLVIAKNYEVKDVTQETIKWVQDLTIETLLETTTWEKLRVLVKIHPDKDLLPVRAQYERSFNIGLNYLSVKSDKDYLWYALADIGNAKILTGESPEIT